MLQLSTGADPNGTDNNASTPLALVCQQEPTEIQIECMKVLFLYGADSNVVDSFGNTPLHLILLYGLHVNLLSEARSLPTAKDDGLAHIRPYQLKSVEAFLSLAVNFDISSENKDGDQPLHIATKLGLIGCMQCILRYQVMRATNDKNMISEANTSRRTSGLRLASSSGVERINIQDKKAHSRRKKSKSPTKKSPRLHRRHNNDISNTDFSSSCDSSVFKYNSTGHFTTNRQQMEDVSNHSDMEISSDSDNKTTDIPIRMVTRSEASGVFYANSNMKPVSSELAGSENRRPQEQSMEPGLGYDRSEESAIDLETHSDPHNKESIVIKNEPLTSHTDLTIKDSNIEIIIDGGNGVVNTDLMSGSESMYQNSDLDVSALEVADDEIADGWLEYCTDQGDKYYYNTSTKHVQWKKPIKAKSIDRKDALHIGPSEKKTVHAYTKSMSSSEYESSRGNARVISIPSGLGSSSATIVTNNQPILNRSGNMSSTTNDALRNGYATDTSNKLSQIPNVVSAQPLISTPDRKPKANATQLSTPVDRSNGSIHRQSLSRNPSISSLSGSESDTASRDKHMEVWNRFFENALMARGNKEKGISVSGFTPRKTSKKNYAWVAPVGSLEYKHLVDAALGPSAQSGDLYETGGKALLASAMRGDIDVAEELLLRGYNPSCVDEQIRTPLHYACRIGESAMVTLLCDYSADVDALDCQGSSPLHVACAFGHLEVVKCLVQYAANIASLNNNQDSPLHVCAATGNAEICQVLLEYGASTSALNSENRTALDIAKASLRTGGSKTSRGLKECISLICDSQAVANNSNFYDDQSSVTDSIELYSEVSDSSSNMDGVDSRRKHQAKSRRSSASDPRKKLLLRKMDMISGTSGKESRVESPSAPGFYDPRRLSADIQHDWIQRGKEKMQASNNDVSLTGRNPMRNSPSSHLPRDLASSLVIDTGASHSVSNNPSTAQELTDSFPVRDASNDSDEDSDNDTNYSRGFGVGSVVWGAASSLIGATMKIFGGRDSTDADNRQDGSKTDTSQKVN
jgi:ankyrin repeat protein